jgi:hypothetical protein
VNYDSIESASRNLHVEKRSFCISNQGPLQFFSASYNKSAHTTSIRDVQQVLSLLTFVSISSLHPD